ncbi:MAG: hypothetical protein ACYCR8_00645 [Cuniculiplasma sp.]
MCPLEERESLFIFRDIVLKGNDKFSDIIDTQKQKIGMPTAQQFGGGVPDAGP